MPVTAVITPAAREDHPHTVAPCVDDLVGVGSGRTTTFVRFINRAQNSRWMSVLGVAYVVATLYGSMQFLSTSASALVNDFFWVGFNATGGSVFVANAFNAIGFGASGLVELALSDPVFVSTSDLAASATAISFPGTFVRLAQYHRLTSVEAGIVGLRRTSSASITYVFTQYCWVDFERRWSVAHTASRAARCERDYITNGAVYMETLLRNVQWGDFMDSWGREFTAGIADPMLETNSTAAQQFLQSIKANASLSVADEATYWRRMGITHHTLQFSNANQIGVSDHIQIVNAFGIAHALTIKKRDFSSRWSAQTTGKMYWSLAGDLWGVVDNNTLISGYSLVRNTTDFYEDHNVTMEQVFFHDGQVTWPLSSKSELLRAAVGPFGSVDMYWQMPPPELFDLMAMVRRVLYRAARSSTAVQAQFIDVSSEITVDCHPAAWNNPDYEYIGGNILCDGASPVKYVTQQLRFDDTCAAPVGAGGRLNRVTAMFAALASGILTPDKIASVCQSGTLNVMECTNIFSKAHAFGRDHVPPEDMQRIQQQVRNVKPALVALNVSIVQFVERPSRAKPNVTETELLVQPLVSVGGDDPWDLFGWLFLADWVQGEREVVSFQGDHGNLTLLSAYVPPVTLPSNSAEVLVSVASYLRIGVQYVTFVIMVVAAIVLGYMLWNRCNVAGSNFLGFNRVTGVVWVGRPLLLLRGIVAICMLSTSSPILVKDGVLTHMEPVQFSWFDNIITAGESTWLLFVAADLLLVVTRGYTYLYAPLAHVTVWLSVAILQLLSPTQHRMVVEPKCEYVQPDNQVQCVSGTVYVGDTTRALIIVAIIMGSLVASYAVARYCCTSRTVRSDSLFLPGIAQEVFKRDGWIYNGEWFLDPASAAMAGLISLSSRTSTTILDIKTWSLLELPGDQTVEQALPGTLRQSMRLGRLKPKQT